MCDAADHLGECRSKQGISRNHPVAARILRRWRELTGGKSVRDGDRRTVVACSGGADSVALAAVLAMVDPKPVIAHVVHDIRDDGLAIADRDAVKQLASSLGCVFVEHAVLVKEQAGNLEHNAREARYGALYEIAGEVGAKIIVTGHHSDDQLETVLMGLIRGSGIRGMGGMSAIREMGNVSIVRPMLEVSREEIEALCIEAGLSWQHDHTNDDEGYLRNRIRHSVLPMLREIEPEVAKRASGAARSCREANELVERVVLSGIVSQATQAKDEWSWTRDELRDESRAILAELVFVFVRDVLDGVGADSINRRSIEGYIRAVKSDDTDPREHRIGPIVVDVHARTVVISVAGAGASEEAPEERS